MYKLISNNQLNGLLSPVRITDYNPVVTAFVYRPIELPCWGKVVNSTSFPNLRGQVVRLIDETTIQTMQSSRYHFDIEKIQIEHLENNSVVLLKIDGLVCWYTVESMVAIGFDNLGQYKTAVQRAVKKIMNKLVKLGYCEKFDFGKGKGKYKKAKGFEFLGLDELAKEYIKSLNV